MRKNILYTIYSRNLCTVLAKPFYAICECRLIQLDFPIVCNKVQKRHKCWKLKKGRNRNTLGVGNNPPYVLHVRNGYHQLNGILRRNVNQIHWLFSAECDLIDDKCVRIEQARLCQHSNSKSLTKKIICID